MRHSLQLQSVQTQPLGLHGTGEHRLKRGGRLQVAGDRDGRHEQNLVAGIIG